MHDNDEFNNHNDIAVQRNDDYHGAMHRDHNHDRVRTDYDDGCTDHDGRQ